MTGTTWEPLRVELDRWKQAGQVARFWLRDDDAVEPTAALEDLLALTDSHHVPLTLAVIPAFTGEALAERLARAPLAAVAVHGWSHQNHAGSDGKKQELGPQRLAETVLGELYQGLLKLKRLYPDALVPMLVPPWNRIDAALIAKLPPLGFEMLSVYGRAVPDSPLPLVNTHVDVIDWHGTRGGRAHAELVGELVEELQARLDGASAEPIGILTHHLVHDATVGDFLTGLFETTAAHPAVEWVPGRALF